MPRFVGSIPPFVAIDDPDPASVRYGARILLLSLVVGVAIIFGVLIVWLRLWRRAQLWHRHRLPRPLLRTYPRVLSRNLLLHGDVRFVQINAILRPNALVSRLIEPTVCKPADFLSFLELSDAGRIQRLDYVLLVRLDEGRCFAPSLELLAVYRGPVLV